MSKFFKHDRPAAPSASRAFYRLQGEDVLLPAEASALKRSSALFLAVMVLLSAPLFWAANAAGLIGDVPSAIAHNGSGHGGSDDDSSGSGGDGDGGDDGDDDDDATAGTSAPGADTAGTTAGDDDTVTNGTQGTSGANDTAGTTAGDDTNTAGGR